MASGGRSKWPISPHNDRGYTQTTTQPRSPGIVFLQPVVQPGTSPVSTAEGARGRDTTSKISNWCGTRISVVFTPEKIMLHFRHNTHTHTHTHTYTYGGDPGVCLQGFQIGGISSAHTQSLASLRSWHTLYVCRHSPSYTFSCFITTVHRRRNRRHCPGRRCIPRHLRMGPAHTQPSTHFPSAL
jgi:hypothetical protein